MVKGHDLRVFESVSREGITVCRKRVGCERHTLCRKMPVVHIRDPVTHCKNDVPVS